MFLESSLKILLCAKTHFLNLGGFERYQVKNLQLFKTPEGRKERSQAIWEHSISLWNQSSSSSQVAVTAVIL